MIFRDSIRNLKRSRGKTLLFSSLLFVLTLASCLSLGIRISVSRYLAECDASYKTVGVFEYMGADYPDDTVYDPKVRETLDHFDFSPILRNENVLRWEPSSRALGYVDGFARSDAAVPYRQNVVVVIGGVTPDYYSGLKAHVWESLYSYMDMTDKIIKLDTSGYAFEEGHSYLVHGEVTLGGVWITLRITPFGSAMAEAAGIRAEDVPSVVDVTDADGGYSVDPDSILRTIAETYRVVNSGVLVLATSDLDALYPFHQQQLILEEGRSFTAEEYRDGAAVCVVTRRLALECSAGVGDEIPLSIAIAKDTPLYGTYWAGTGFAAEGRYRIVGIANGPAEMSHYVVIPRNGDIDYAADPTGYTLGSAVLKNGSDDAFYEAVEPLLPDSVRLTIYDQGYSAVRQPFGEILRIASIITAISLLLSLATLVLFGFLFVYRQREVAGIMSDLGVGRIRVYLYFLFGTGLIALASSFAGAFAAYGLTGLTARLVRWAAVHFAASDRHYSSVSMTAQKLLDFVPHLRTGLFLAAALTAAAAALLSALLFTRAALARRRQTGHRRRPFAPRKAARSSRLPGGPMKYSLLSIRRGGPRSAIIPAVTLLAVLLLSQLSRTAASYEARLAAVYADSSITARFTDYAGRQTGGLLLEACDLNVLDTSGYIKDLGIYYGRNVEYLGRTVIGGEAHPVDDLAVPANGFAAESLYIRISRGPEILFTNDLFAAPEFFYVDTVKTAYLDGYDASFLGQPAAGVPGCMVSTEMMERESIGLGDTIKVAIATDRPSRYAHLEMRVVGSFEKRGVKDNIYCQLAAYMDPGLLSGDPGEVREELFRYKFNGARFTVTDPSRLNAFKTFLADTGFSEVRKIGMIREFVVIEDRIFSGTVDTLSRQIRYVKILYPLLYLLVGALGLILCYLLTAVRKREYAVMRGLGVPRKRAFLSLFLEQAILCLAGCLAGMFLWSALYGAVSLPQGLLAAGFLLSCFAGSLIAARIMDRRTALEIFSEET